MTTVNELEGRVETHEAVCAERYDQINARLKRIEKIIMWSAATFITGGSALGFVMFQMLLQARLH